MSESAYPSGTLLYKVGDWGEFVPAINSLWVLWFIALETAYLVH